MNAVFISGLEKSFGDLRVLQGIGLELPKGENLVVLGRSGSGKSVLIKIIAGLLSADAGRVEVLGQDIGSLQQAGWQALRQKIGFSFQGSALYDGMSVRENLAFPLTRNHRKMPPDQVQAAIEEALEHVGLLQTIDQMPAELSGGQKKRVGIARMLVMQPELILYDEPTGGLDPVTCVEINQLIRSVQHQYNTSAIIITHDLSCAKATGEKVAMLWEGKILRHGTFDEVFLQTDDERLMGFYRYNFIHSS